MTTGHARLPLPLRACTLSCRRHRREPLRPWRSPVRSARPFTLPCVVTVPSAGHLLRTAPRESTPPVHPAAHTPRARGLVSLLWLVVVVETGLLGGFWLRSDGWPWTTRPVVLSRAGSAPDGQRCRIGPARPPDASRRDDGSPPCRRGAWAADRPSAGQHASDPGGLRP